MSFWAILLSLSGIASLVAWVGLINVAFRNGEKNWGILLVVSVFVPFLGPIVALAFVVKFWSIARTPAMVFLGSLVLAIVGTVGIFASLGRMARELADDPEFAAAARQVQGLQAESETDAAAPNPDTPTSPPAPEVRPPVPAATVASRPRPEPILRTSPPVPSVPTTADPGPIPVRDDRVSPLSVETLRLGEPTPLQMRTLVAQARNTSTQAVHEARLGLTYFDDRGLRLGRWTTVHTESPHIVPGHATNEFTIQAFFVPQFTKSVRIDVEFVRFANGDRWPPLDPALAPPPAPRAAP